MYRRIVVVETTTPYNTIKPHNFVSFVYTLRKHGTALYEYHAFEVFTEMYV